MSVAVVREWSCKAKPSRYERSLPAAHPTQGPRTRKRLGCCFSTDNHFAAFQVEGASDDLVAIQGDVLRLPLRPHQDLAVLLQVVPTNARYMVQLLAVDPVPTVVLLHEDPHQDHPALRSKTFTTPRRCGFPRISAAVVYSWKFRSSVRPVAQESRAVVAQLSGWGR